MEDTIETVSSHERTTNISARAAGVASLLLIFFASLSFTWVFLADSGPAPATVAAAAEAAPPPAPIATPFDNMTLQAKSAIIIDETTGQTLYEKNADAPLPLASLTKVALALVVAQILPADTVITIPYDTSPYQTSQKLRAGERWKLQDVIDFTLAVSSNQGADILAAQAEIPIRTHYPLAPEGGATVWRMNELAQNLGLTHMYFLNDNGLDESETQAGAYGSARDVAGLFAYAASSSPQTFAATTRQTFTLHSVDGSESTAVNTDEALPAIPGIIMGKTGFTDLAGGNLAIVFEIDGHRLSAVVLGSTQQGRFDDMKILVATVERSISR